MDLRRRFRIGRKMSHILRHCPPPKSIDSFGWIYVHILIENMRKLNPTLEELREVVEKDTKGRFVIDELCDPARIRATQGHSIFLENPILELLDSSTEIQVVIHGTTEEGFKEIEKCRELRSMRREYIHFAIEQKHVRSNNNTTVFLRLKLKEAQNAGHVFMLSTNGVLLCKGPLPVEFVNCVKYEDLLAYWKV